MRDEWKDEQALKDALDSYIVPIPKERLIKKETKYERLIRYLFSATENPLEKIPESKYRLASFQFVPLYFIVFLSMIQVLYFFK